MVKFNELRITPDNSHLIIDAEVLDVLAYENVYIDAIYIDNQDTFNPEGSTHSSQATKVYETTEGSTIKQARVVLTASGLATLGLNIGDLLFVCVVTKGEPSDDTPCGYDDSTTLGIVYQLHKLYVQSINYLKEVTCDCKLPKHLIDWIVRLKAFELSIKTSNFALTIKYWKKFFANIKTTSSSTNSCSCYG